MSKNYLKWMLLGMLLFCLAHQLNAQTPTPTPVQTPTPIPCPTVKIEAQSKIKAGETITFTANIVGQLPPNSSPVYRWRIVTDGVYQTSSNGTPVFTVQTDNTSPGNLTVEVNVSGIEGCPVLTDSTNIVITTIIIPARIDDWDQRLSVNEEKARLSSLNDQLQQNPGAQGFLIVYRKCGTSATQTRNRLNRIRQSLRGLRFDLSRYTLVDGGCKDTLTVQAFLVPDGAAPPVPDR
jgi:hypothetical protein